MSRKCKVLASFVCFVVLLSVLFGIASFSPRPKLIPEDGDNASPEISLSFSSTTDVVCSLEDPQTKPVSQSYPPYEPPNLKGPSLITFLQASSTEGNKDLTFDGLAVLSTLVNACQSLIDVKARVQVKQNCSHRDKGGNYHNMFVLRPGNKSAARRILYADIFSLYIRVGGEKL